jgi:deoxyribodipyrimidine photolyase
MQKRHTILYWVRDKLVYPHNLFLHPGLKQCTCLVPVFCSDRREKNLLCDSTLYSAFNDQELNNMDLLRMDLISKGNNLLYVEGHYDKLIPSLARVLQVDEVIIGVDELTWQTNSSLDQIRKFREQAFTEVSSILRMHSIPTDTDRVITKRQNGGNYDFLPSFPGINTGSIRPCSPAVLM